MTKTIIQNDGVCVCAHACLCFWGRNKALEKKLLSNVAFTLSGAARVPGVEQNLQSIRFQLIQKKI